MTQLAIRENLSSHRAQKEIQAVPSEKGEVENMMTKRKYLKKGNGGKKLIDMEKVYVQLDAGRSVKSVAKEWGVSPSTIYRRHREYQAEVELCGDSELPPLPESDLDPVSEKL